jgi:A/G-specific adenine glycosylase
MTTRIGATSFGAIEFAEKLEAVVLQGSDPTQPAFASALTGWYDRHKRALPWRESTEPYRVWLSEIMLQQTRVAAVLEHYQRFLKKFPTVEKLASARESSVLAAWSGLGYYRRARMLHAAAKKVAREYGGKLPATSEDLRMLPGIGRYTAAAIASIAFGEPVAVVDGNVERVLSRVAGRRLAGEETWRLAQSRLSEDRPGDFNQAMMELGAMVCLPGAPKCLLCPIRSFCATQGELAQNRRNGSQKKRRVQYALGQRDGAIFLVQRAQDASLMPGMWELPEIEALNAKERPMLRVRHSITVTDYDVRVMESIPSPDREGTWVSQKRLPSMALTGLTRKILRRTGLI